MDASEFSPFLDGENPTESLERLSEASRTNVRPLPPPTPGKFRAVLYKPARHIPAWKWALPFVIGGPIAAVPAMLAYGAWAHDGAVEAAVATIIAAPFFGIGLLIMWGGNSTQRSNNAGRVGAVFARKQSSGKVSVRVALAGVKSAKFASNSELAITKISGGHPRGADTAGVTVTLGEVGGDGQSIQFYYPGDFDEDTFHQLRSGLREYGLRPTQSFSDLPPRV